MTNPTTLTVDETKFDRQTIFNLGDTIDELIWDRYGDILMDIGSNAVGPQRSDESEEEYLEREMDAASAAKFLVLKSILGETVEYETE